MASLLAGGGRTRDGLVRGGPGSGALSPLPEVQFVESLTPDSPSHVLTLDVHRTDEEADGATSSVLLTEEVEQHSEAASEQRDVPFIDFVMAGIPISQPPRSIAQVSPSAVLALTPRSGRVSPPPSPPASLLSSALLEADLDYFHVDRETAIAVEQLTSPGPHSPHSTDDNSDDNTDELNWEEEDDNNDEQQIVRLRDEFSKRQGSANRAQEDDWEVCRVAESSGGGGTDDEYELL